tara:strand:+ start:220 stop:525 length:306 start_codon:yes stop_codon:yes gene_type:complete
METLETLETQLLNFQDDMHLEMMSFDEEQGTRFSFWIGEQFDDRDSMRQLLQESELMEFSSLLRQLMRDGTLSTCMDDGWFHLTFQTSLFTESFTSELLFD